MTIKRYTTLLLILWQVALAPAIGLAQSAVDAQGNPTGPQGCTGAGCGQGVGQGSGQGVANGGPSLEALGGYVNDAGNEVLPAGVEDTRQGAGQGSAQGSSNGVKAVNSNTGAGSANDINSDVAAAKSTNIDNSSNTNTSADVAASTGGNSQSRNTGAGGLTTGNAAVSATVVTTDNTATTGGQAGFNNQKHTGNHTGNYAVGFGAGTANLLDQSGANKSYQLINEVTGSNSDNTINAFSRLEEIVEVQNDGVIDNDITVAANTGDNAANDNTGAGTIKTGNADVAVTLINLLNTTVINGDLWVTVADIFGNLDGDILINDLASYFSGNNNQLLDINAGNGTTGSDSSNAIDITVDDEETFTVNNDADITTNVTANANTGGNETNANTLGGDISTGNASVAASNTTIANTTVEGGNWGLFVVNALNGWLGFLIGDNGSVQALSSDETIREIEARNDQTGSDSDNTITVVDETTRTTDIENDAVINNDITVEANTGRNEANRNTGGGVIATGDASIKASAVNIANTTVKDGSLFIAVINVFGDWFGDLLYRGASLAAAAGNAGLRSVASDTDISIDARNEETGSESDNTIEIDVNQRHETTITNEADLNFTLNAAITTGGNRANRNTFGGEIETGDGLLAQYSRTIANTTGLAVGAGSLRVDAEFNNDTTGFNSTNTIRATIDKERMVTISNDATITTMIGSLITPLLINTGNNEASDNTVGGDISTGNILADLAIENMINQVISAWLNGATAGDMEIDVDFRNELTGSISDNLNDLAATYEVLKNIDSSAIIDNIVNLLLNTGSNVSSRNTASLRPADSGVYGRQTPESDEPMMLALANASSPVANIEEEDVSDNGDENPSESPLVKRGADEDDDAVIIIGQIGSSAGPTSFAPSPATAIRPNGLTHVRSQNVIQVPAVTAVKGGEIVRGLAAVETNSAALAASLALLTLGTLTAAQTLDRRATQLAHAPA